MLVPPDLAETVKEQSDQPENLAKVLGGAKISKSNKISLNNFFRAQVMQVFQPKMTSF